MVSLNGKVENLQASRDRFLKFYIQFESWVRSGVAFFRISTVAFLLYLAPAVLDPCEAFLAPYLI